MNVAKYVSPSTVPTDHKYEFLLKWGTNGEGDGEFSGPQGVVVAPDGSVYVSDCGNDRIQKFSVGP